MLIIRLQRLGKKKFPTYRLVISEKTKDTQGTYLEELGNFNPHAKENQLVAKVDRIKYWISKGAQMSDTISNLFVANHIIEGKKKKSVYLSKKRQTKIAEKKKTKEEAEAKAKADAAAAAEAEAKARVEAEAAEKAKAEAQATAAAAAAAESAKPAEATPVAEPAPAAEATPVETPAEPAANPEPQA